MLSQNELTFYSVFAQNLPNRIYSSFYYYLASATAEYAIYCIVITAEYAIYCIVITAEARKGEGGRRRGDDHRTVRIRSA